MRNLRTLIIFISIIHFSSVYAQNQNKIDSLNRVLSVSFSDTNKVYVLIHLCDEHSNSNPDKALECGNLGLALAKKLNFKKGIALCLNNIGSVHYIKGEYKDAINFYWHALKVNEEIGNKKGLANNLSNIGAIYRTQGSFEKARKYFIKALKLDEESGNKSASAANNTNIGNIYYDDGNYKKALEYYQLGLSAFKKLSDKQNTATVLNNIGSIYFALNDFQKAIEHYNHAMTIYESTGDKVGVGVGLNNIGRVYYSQKNYKKAIEYYKKSLVLAKEIGAQDIMKYDFESLSEVSETIHNYKDAFNYQRLFASIKDTLLNAQINKQMDEMAIKYETSKKEKENALLKKETTKQHFLNQQQKAILNYLVLGLIIIGGTGLMLFIRGRSRKKTNKFLQELVELKTQEENELRKAKNAVEQSMKLKEQFLANISHEIRTPLNAIIGFTDLLHKGNLGFNEKEYIHFIKSAGENLVNIVNDILDMSKIEASMIIFEEKPINISELFKSLKILLDHNAKEKNLKFSFNCNDNLPPFVSGDPTRLTQIFINLIGNAIKFTEVGKISVSASLLKQENDDFFLEFSVIDTGIGIPKEKIDIIFDRFTQAEADTTRKYGGTGLGLSIVKHLIELQKGTIEVSSELEKGSSFTFIMPFKQALQEREETNVILKERRPLKGLNILLVEDNVLNVKLVLALFAKSDVEIDVCENGKEAIDQLQKRNYDIILMDMQMPVMDGYQATTHIREELKNNIPIIAITAHAMTGEKEKCLQLGMNDYIPKPINADVLFDKIYNVTHNIFEDKNSDVNVGSSNSGKLINLNYLIKDLGIKSLTVKEMLDDFKVQMSEDFPSLSEAVMQTDYKTIKDISHKLKSPAAMMGMSQMEKILLDIEVQATSNEGIEKIRNSIQELQVTYVQVLEEIEIEKNNL